MFMSQKMDRRIFLKLSGYLATGAAVGGLVKYVNRQPPNHADVNPGLPLPDGLFPDRG
jgi:hypothetical protein